MRPKKWLLQIRMIGLRRAGKRLLVKRKKRRKNRFRSMGSTKFSQQTPHPCERFRAARVEWQKRRVKMQDCWDVEQRNRFPHMCAELRNYREPRLIPAWWTKKPSQPRETLQHDKMNSDYHQKIKRLPRQKALSESEVKKLRKKPLGWCNSW